MEIFMLWPISLNLKCLKQKKSSVRGALVEYNRRINVFYIDFLFDFSVAVEKERQEREKKKKETQEWESKLKGSKYLYVKNNVQEHPS